MYRNVLRVLETNPFEPRSREIKYYAPRVGLIRDDEGLDRNLKNPDLIFRRDDDGRRDRAERADSRRDRPRADAGATGQRAAGRRRSAAIGAPGASGAEAKPGQGAAAPAAPQITTTLAPICTRS